MQNRGKVLGRIAIVAVAVSLLAACVAYEPSPGYGYYDGPAYYYSYPGPYYYGGGYYWRDRDYGHDHWR